ncbi:MAG TPA: choice-of-anchor tandem repeat GloVer-containing protein [Stellaceae bacterium]|jgi:uncharacterized repeat protein (TIGR03803 family)
MVVDASGNLFGTQSGDTDNGDGAVFEVANSGSGYAATPTTVASFEGTDAKGPSGGLISDTAGNLFGVTSNGGANNDGTIFEVAKTADGYASTPTVLASFDSTDGVPATQLVMDSAGDLFGVAATRSGASREGTVFELAKTADGYASAPTALAQFEAAYYLPNPLVLDAHGNVFGTTVSDGANGDGTVFELAKTADGYSAPTTLVSFSSADGGASGALVADAAGNLFGVTNGGGANGSGEIFEIAKTADGYASTATVLASFPQENDGAGSLIIDGADNLFVQQLPGGGPSGGELYELPKTDGLYASTVTALAEEPFSTSNGLTGGSAGNIFGATDGFGQLGGYTNSTIYEVTGTGYVPVTGSTGETLGANDTAGQQLTGTPNNDTFYAGHESVAMTGDGGADTFVFQYLPWNAGAITDFNTATDTLDLSGIFASIGYTGSNPVADGYLTFQSDGQGDTQVYVDTHQSSDPWPNLITTLDGVAPSSITPADYGYGSSGGTGAGTGGGSTVDDSQPTYTVPDGITNVVLTGSAPQTVTANDAGDTITSNDYGSTLIGGSGNDTLIAGHEADTLTGGGGNDFFVFNAAPWNAGHITDFTVGADKLDLSALLGAAGYSGSDPVADGYVTFASDGSGNTEVLFNPHNADDPYGALITTLDGVSPGGLTSADTLGTAGSSSGGGAGTTVETSDANYTAPSGVTTIILTDSAPQTVTANNAGDTITSNDQSSTIIGGSGNDTLIAGHEANIFTGNGGDDSFVFNYLPWNAGQITDFNTATDVLNLKGIFQAIGYTGSNPVADGYLNFTADGNGNTEVIVNPHDSADPWGAVVTTLEHVSPSAIHSGDYVFA